MKKPLKKSLKLLIALAFTSYANLLLVSHPSFVYAAELITISGLYLIKYF